MNCTTVEALYNVLFLELWWYVIKSLHCMFSSNLNRLLIEFKTPLKALPMKAFGIIWIFCSFWCGPMKDSNQIKSVDSIFSFFFATSNRFIICSNIFYHIFDVILIWSDFECINIAFLYFHLISNNWCSNNRKIWQWIWSLFELIFVVCLLNYLMFFAVEMMNWI